MAPPSASPARPGLRRPTRPPAPDRLFAALDGRDLVVSGLQWHLEVYGICEQAGRRWIQVAVDGPQHHMLTMALAADLGARQAVRAISGWLANPAVSDSILSVV